MAYVDVELGASSGIATDYTCDNKVCNRAFHSVCLEDWLLTLTTTRQYVQSQFFCCISLSGNSIVSNYLALIMIRSKN